MSSIIPAHGAHTDNGTPRSVTAVTPFLAVRDAASAIRFYTEVLGATEVYRTEMPGADGALVIVHAALDFGGRGRIEVGEAVDDWHLAVPPEGDVVTFSLGLFVPDVDAVAERAVAAGATLREEPSDFVSGDRYASIRDPFGIRWSIMTRIEDLSDAESVARVQEWAASAGS